MQFNRLEALDDDRVFMVENQGVCLWGADADEATATVWIRENEPGRPWEREGEPLDTFLLQAAVFEQVMSGEHAGIVIDLPQGPLDRALALLTPLPWRPWLWPAHPTSFHVGDDALALVVPMGELHQFQVAALNAEALERFGAIVGDWDYLSERDA
jgi:hypothetical protein